MKRRVIVVLSTFVFALVIPSTAEAGSLCNNGKMSSNSGRGTCSYNGGVNKSAPSYSDPYSSSFNRNNGLGGLSSTGKNSLTGKSCQKGVYVC